MAMTLVTLDNTKPGDWIETVYGRRYQVKVIGMIPYPVVLVDVIPVPAVVTNGGGMYGQDLYFNLALSGIKKVEP